MTLLHTKEKKLIGLIIGRGKCRVPRGWFGRQKQLLDLCFFLFFLSSSSPSFPSLSPFFTSSSTSPSFSLFFYLPSFPSTLPILLLPSFPSSFSTLPPFYLPSVFLYFLSFPFLLSLTFYFPPSSHSFPIHFPFFPLFSTFLSSLFPAAFISFYAGDRDELIH